MNVLSFRESATPARESWLFKSRSAFLLTNSLVRTDLQLIGPHSTHHPPGTCKGLPWIHPTQLLKISGCHIGAPHYSKSWWYLPVLLWWHCNTRDKMEPCGTSQHKCHWSEQQFPQHRVLEWPMQMYGPPSPPNSASIIKGYRGWLYWTLQKWLGEFIYLLYVYRAQSSKASTRTYFPLSLQWWR